MGVVPRPSLLPRVGGLAALPSAGGVEQVESLAVGR